MFALAHVREKNKTGTSSSSLYHITRTYYFINVETYVNTNSSPNNKKKTMTTKNIYTYATKRSKVSDKNVFRYLYHRVNLIFRVPYLTHPVHLIHLFEHLETYPYTYFAMLLDFNHVKRVRLQKMFSE